MTGALYFAGQHTNFFDPNNGGVPPGVENSAGTTVTIGDGIEFGYLDSFNFDVANFTGTTLTVADLADLEGTAPFEMDFTDSDPSFTNFTLDDSSAGYTYSFAGNTLRVFFAGASDAGQYDADFTYGAAVTPEPSSLLLLGTGVLGGFGVVRRRYSR